jgi:hypothetical protein
MYLTGDKFVPEYQDKFPRAKVDSYPVESLRLQLGYWRKHWALHNYIEANYNGFAELGKVDLDSEALRIIADAVEQGKMPDADYFDEVDAHHKEPEQVANTVKVFRDAADWVDGGDWRSVEYVGSW